VKLWDLQTQQLKWESINSGGTGSSALAISPDDRWIIFPDDRARVNLISTETGKLETSFTGHTRNITALAFHPDSDRFVSGSVDGTIRLWSIARPGGIATMRLHRETVNSIAFNLDGTRMISGGADHALVVADVETAQELVTIRDVDSPVVRVAAGPDQRTVALVTEAGELRIFDARADRGELMFQADSAISSIAFHPGGRRIATGSVDGIIQLWDAIDGVPQGRLEEHQYPVTSIQFISQDDDGLMSTLGDPFDTIRKMREGEFRLQRWDVRSGLPRLNILAHRYSIVHSSVSPNGKVIATTSMDGTCCLWDTQQGSLIRTLKVSIPVGDSAFDPQNRILVLGSVDATIRIFEVETGKMLPTLSGHTMPVLSISFSPDGRQLLSVGVSLDPKRRENVAEVIVWDWETRTEKFRLKGIRNRVFRAEFSPDGTMIGTTGGLLFDFDLGGGEVKLWDANSGNLLREFPEQVVTAFALAFSPDSRRIAVAGSNRVVRVWDISMGESR